MRYAASATATPSAMSGSDMAASQSVAEPGIHRHEGEAAEPQCEKERIKHFQLLSFDRANMKRTT